MVGTHSPETYSDKRSLLANEIMSCPVVTATERTDIKAIAKKMKEHDIDTVVITNKENEPIGVVTEGDIVRRLLSRKKSMWFMKARHVMSKPVIAVGETIAVEEMARRMVTGKVKRLCVVNDRKKLVGIVTQTDIIENASHLIDVLREIISTSNVTDEEALQLDRPYRVEKERR